jgi:hypothetical protein
MNISCTLISLVATLMTSALSMMRFMLMTAFAAIGHRTRNIALNHFLCIAGASSYHFDT